MTELQAATDRMESIISRGRVSAEALLEKIHTEVPQDRLLRGRTLGFRYAAPSTLNGTVPGVVELADAQGLTEEDGTPKLIAACLDTPTVTELDVDPDWIPPLLIDVANQDSERLHKNALSQIAGRAGVPTKYMRELVQSPNPELRALAIRILETHFQKTSLEDTRYLSRSVDGEMRGFLSDRYRRLDSRPLLDKFAQHCQEIGAVPVDGTFSDTRVALKAYIPRVLMPIPGEPMLIGLEWGNSDYGCGSHTLRVALLRLWCRNGCTFEDAIRNIHLGRQLDDDIAFSRVTYDLDTKAAASAMGDIIHHHLSPEQIEKSMAAIADAHDTSISRTSFAATIKKVLSKSDAEKVLDAYDNDTDVEHLPAVMGTAWRASNAVSWIAGTKAGDTKLSMQRLAGKVLTQYAKAA